MDVTTGGYHMLLWPCYGAKRKEDELHDHFLDMLSHSVTFY